MQSFNPQEPFPFDLSYMRYVESSQSRYAASEWQKYVSMNGTPYYYNKSLRAITPDDISQEPLRRRHIEILEEYIAGLEEDFVLPPDLEHIIQLVADDYNLDGSGTDGDGISLATPRDYAMTNLSLELETALGFHDESFEHVPAAYYWSYLSEYPMHYTRIPVNVEKEFLCALAYGATDRVITGDQSTFRFSDRFVPAILWHIAMVMEEIWHRRREFRYGIISVGRPEQIYGPSTMTQISDLVMAIFFFGAPALYTRRLEETRREASVYVPVFRDMMKSLLVEWTNSNLLATVFVLTSIGFLTLPGLSSLQKTVSLVSTFFAIISVMSGIHHVWQHKGKVDAQQDDAHGYVFHARLFGPNMGLRLTACFLSVPIVSLLWSVFSFMVALIAYCVQDSDERGEVFLGVIFAVIIVWIIGAFLCFWDGWQICWTLDACGKPTGKTHQDPPCAANEENTRTFSAWLDVMLKKLRSNFPTIG
ncbi:hypothetical protein BV22DRAFT_648393 [Leucogyrophana mollusca]|uniref:Uncharacterized protein n=1 Tax=Leucogyrophana mollusca TaxID=85980 RepID=A0ACB8BAT5_9AGAM|nr:hypothetical protein BV22DRAFT_648393 [Leucogyrophana mollusca]